MSESEIPKMNLRSALLALLIVLAVLLAICSCGIVLLYLDDGSFIDSSSWMNREELAKTIAGDLVPELMRAEFPREHDDWDYVIVYGNKPSIRNEKVTQTDRIQIVAYAVRPSRGGESVVEVEKIYILLLRDGVVTNLGVSYPDRNLYGYKPKAEEP